MRPVASSHQNTANLQIYQILCMKCLYTVVPSETTHPFNKKNSTNWYGGVYWSTRNATAKYTNKKYTPYQTNRARPNKQGTRGENRYPRLQWIEEHKGKLSGLPCPLCWSTRFEDSCVTVYVLYNHAWRPLWILEITVQLSLKDFICH